MFERYFRQQIVQLLEKAGIGVDGRQPYDMIVHDQRLFQRILSSGNLGLGEAFMEGWWDCPELDDFFFRVLRARVDNDLVTPAAILGALAGKLFNFQLKSRSYRVAEKHYNIGNDLFRGMLDSNMLYSCAYWENTDDLRKAQENKLRLIFNKLMLEPGMRVLDIGCGWGGSRKICRGIIRGSRHRDNHLDRTGEGGSQHVQRPSRRNQADGLPGPRRNIRPDILDRDV